MIKEMSVKLLIGHFELQTKPLFTLLYYQFVIHGGFIALDLLNFPWALKSDFYYCDVILMLSLWAEQQNVGGATRGNINTHLQHCRLHRLLK